VPVLTPCSGPHNNAWRKAEALGLPHEITPTWGTPVHCLGCTGKAYRQLAELPELLAAVWLEAEYGTPAKLTGTIGRIHIPAWPGQSGRLMTDYIVGGLIELEEDIREQRHLRPRLTDVREGVAATNAVTLLLTHLDWALTLHPAASEPHDRDSANPASQISYWNRAATRFTRRDALRVQCAAPCPRCQLRTLAHSDGEEYIECSNVGCGALLTPGEYATYAGEVAAAEQYERAACA
jgi:hypothetical protein